MRILSAFLACAVRVVCGSTGLSAEVVPENPTELYKMHVCAFHIAKDDPKVVIETQHYCAPLTDQLFQCLLYETVEVRKPKLLGVEYVISDKLYQQLPQQEKNLWHPHDYEVREGLLALVGASKGEDQEAAKILMNTWGKTWHTWPDPTTAVPLGAPRLMWSAVKAGDVPEKMIQERDHRWGIDTSALKQERDQSLL